MMSSMLQLGVQFETTGSMPETQCLSVAVEASSSMTAIQPGREHLMSTYMYQNVAQMIGKLKGMQSSEHSSKSL